MDMMDYGDDDDNLSLSLLYNVGEMKLESLVALVFSVMKD